MAAFIEKSDLLENMDGGTVESNVAKAKLRLVTIRDKVSVATTAIDTIGDTIGLCPIPSRATIKRIEIVNADLDSNGSPALAVDLGLYTRSQDGELTVVDADLFASAVATLQAATTSWTDLTYESGVITNVNRHKRLWENAGASVDPKTEYFIAFTVTAAAGTAAAGDIVYNVEYLID